MRLKRLLNDTRLQVYSIENSSKSFRKQFPKRHILVYYLDRGDGRYYYNISNTNEYPSILESEHARGYVFTYDTKIPHSISRLKSPKMTIPPVSACGLSDYLSGVSEALDVVCVLQLSLGEFDGHPLMVHPLTILMNSEKMSDDASTIKNGLLKSVNEYIMSQSNESVESWLKYVINICPMRTPCMPLHFGDTITDTSLMTQCTDTTIRNLSIHYDMRFDNESVANAFVASLESIPKWSTPYIICKDSVDGLVDRLIKCCNDNGFAYTVIDADGYYPRQIKMKREEFVQCDIEYTILDLL